MNSRYMQEAVEIELSQSDVNYELKNKLQSREIFYYLTKSQRNFIQNVYKEGVEKNEPNKKKLGNILKTSVITGGDITTGTFYPNSFEVVLPTDCLYVTNERMDATIDSETLTNIYVKPGSFDEYSVNKNNPYRKPTIDKCLRLEGAGKHTILTPEDTDSIENVYIDYIKNPEDIDLSNDCELHVDVHPNIVTGAVSLILGAKQEQIGYAIQSKEEKENQ